jgi:hypothetical protein
MKPNEDTTRAYLIEIARYPLLKKTEEIELARKIAVMQSLEELNPDRILTDDE